MSSHTSHRATFSSCATYTQEIGKVSGQLSSIRFSLMNRCHATHLYTIATSYGLTNLGFENPDHLHHYAKYLDCRIRSYANLKHDVIKVQSESNRDLRSSAIHEEQEEQTQDGKRRGSGSANTGLGRSKTVMGRKLRIMTVEKGLLRETKAVHQMIDAVVECRVCDYLWRLIDILTLPIVVLFHFNGSSFTWMVSMMNCG